METFTYNHLKMNLVEQEKGQVKVTCPLVTVYLSSLLQQEHPFGLDIVSRLHPVKVHPGGDRSAGFVGSVPDDPIFPRRHILID